MSLIEAKERFRGGIEPSGAIDSPCLSVVYGALAAANKVNILNVGVLSQSFLNYFAQFNCKMWVLDLHRELMRYETEQDGDTLENDPPPFPALFDKTADQPAHFDLILLWDYFNYLSGRTITPMMDQISHACKKGTLLYFFTALRGDMPQLPGRFDLLAGEQLEYTPVLEQGVIPSPDYGPHQLMEMMPSFSILKLSRLGNGTFQENLFEFKGYRSPPDMKYRVDRM